MAFDNQLGKGKDRRKPYRDSRSFDWQCRHGGSCDWCSNNRQFASFRRVPIVEEYNALIAPIGRAAHL